MRRWCKWMVGEDIEAVGAGGCCTGQDWSEVCDWRGLALGVRLVLVWGLVDARCEEPRGEWLTERCSARYSRSCMRLVGMHREM